MKKSDNPSIYSVIDVGTNNILLLIARRGAELEIIERDSATSALGKNMLQGILQKEAIERAQNILADYIKRSQKYTAKIIIIGTSCSREAKNIGELKDWLWRSYRLPYQIISGETEAYLNGLANQEEFPSASKLLLFDVGGGSTEFTLIQDKKIVRYQSVNIGIRRFEQKYGTNWVKVKAAISSLLPLFDSQEKADLTLVGIGGTACSLAALLHNMQVYDSRVVHGSFIANYQLQELISNLAKMSLSQLVESLPFDRQRADIIRLGSTIVKEIVDSFQTSGFFVSDRSLQFGVLRQSDEKLAQMLKRKEICLK